jgi:hypothetical protein
MKMKWRVLDEDWGHGDGYEWSESVVTNGRSEFKAASKRSAQWLARKLNNTKRKGTK